MFPSPCGRPVPPRVEGEDARSETSVRASSARPVWLALIAIALGIVLALVKTL